MNESTFPAGTLLGVSLACWWHKENETDLRCSLQLLGWDDLYTATPAVDQVNAEIREEPW